jgi:hypothetical protein
MKLSGFFWWEIILLAVQIALIGLVGVVFWLMVLRNKAQRFVRRRRVNDMEVMDDPLHFFSTFSIVSSSFVKLFYNFLVVSLHILPG